VLIFFKLYIIDANENHSFYSLIPMISWCSLIYGFHNGISKRIMDIS